MPAVRGLYEKLSYLLGGESLLLLAMGIGRVEEGDEDDILKIGYGENQVFAMFSQKREKVCDTSEKIKKKLLCVLPGKVGAEANALVGSI